MGPFFCQMTISDTTFDHLGVDIDVDVDVAECWQMLGECWRMLLMMSHEINFRTTHHRLAITCRIAGVHFVTLVLLVSFWAVNTFAH